MTTILLIVLIPLAVVLLAWPTWRLLLLLERLAQLPPPDHQVRRFCENLLHQRGTANPVTVIHGGNTDRLVFDGRVLVLRRKIRTDALRAVLLATTCSLVDATRRLPSLVAAVDAARLLGLSCQVAGISLLIAAVVAGRPHADLHALGLALILVTAVSVAVWIWDRYWAFRTGALATRMGHPEIGTWAGALADARAPGVAWYVVHAVLVFAHGMRAAVRLWLRWRLQRRASKPGAAPPSLDGDGGGQPATATWQPTPRSGGDAENGATHALFVPRVRQHGDLIPPEQLRVAAGSDDLRSARDHGDHCPWRQVQVMDTRPR